jgi:hypothetical protein
VSPAIPAQRPSATGRAIDIAVRVLPLATIPFVVMPISAATTTHPIGADIGGALISLGALMAGAAAWAALDRRSRTATRTITDWAIVSVATGVLISVTQAVVTIPAEAGPATVRVVGALSEVPWLSVPVALAALAGSAVGGAASAFRRGDGGRLVV